MLLGEGRFQGSLVPRARPLDQGWTDLCSLYAISNAIVETLKKSNNIYVSCDDVAVALNQLDFVKVKGGHDVTEFDGAKLKNIIDRATGVPYDVTLEIKEHSVDAELLQDINRKSISCVLDYIQQDGERHCVFIDSLETRDTFGILYTPWIPCIPWILWNGSSEEIFFSASTVGEIILDIQKLMFTKLVTKYFR